MSQDRKKFEIYQTIIFHHKSLFNVFLYLKVHQRFMLIAIMSPLNEKRDHFCRLTNVTNLILSPE